MSLLTNSASCTSGYIVPKSIVCVGGSWSSEKVLTYWAKRHFRYMHNAESSATSSLHTLQNDPIACVRESPDAPSEKCKEDNIRVLTKNIRYF